MKIKRNDILWKGILEDIFDDFLLFIFKAQASIFDFSKGFEFLNSELAQIYPVDENTAHPKFVDKLVKVYTKDGGNEWVLVHVEVQGYNDPGFAKRMFTYFYRILDKFDKQVTCITLFTGNEKSPAVQQYDYSFLGTENRFKYNVYNIIDQDIDELGKSDNPFALVVQTVLIALQKSQIGEIEALNLYKKIARRLLQKDITPAKTRAIMNFLKYYVNFENKENVLNFDEEIKILTDNVITMGIEELLIKTAEIRGREEYQYLTVENLLKKTDFSDIKIADIACVNVSFVQEVKEELGL